MAAAEQIGVTGQTTDSGPLVPASIAVFPASALGEHRRLFSAVAELTGVRFVAASEPDVAHDAMLVVNCTPDTATAIAERARRCLAFVGAAAPVAARPSDPVALAGHAAIPAAFRGCVLPEPALAAAPLAGGMAGDETLATRGTDRLWIRRQAGARNVELVAARLAELQPAEYLFSQFTEGRWFALLPLLHFARDVSGWSYPAARACFMFDDPNLHWRSYGYVDYPAIARDARARDYHVSFATVPMDGWYVDRRASRVFQRSRGRMSLLIHGNNHTRLELHRQRSDASRLALAAQSLRRAERLEQAAGVPVARVMAAPHGACSPEMAHALARTGFEAACISRGSLMTRNPGRSWPAAIGLAPAEFFGDGLPVIPRLGFAAISPVLSRLAIFLGQPLVPMGHHEDLRQGLGRLQDTAAIINSTGRVSWTSPSDIVRSNYLTRHTPESLHVKLYSRRVHLAAPEAATIVVERPWLREGEVEYLTAHDQLGLLAEGSSDRLHFPRLPVGELRITALHPALVDARRLPAETTPLSAVVRRHLCETRDRLRPSLDRVSRLVHPETRAAEPVS